MKTAIKDSIIYKTRTADLLDFIKLFWIKADPNLDVTKATALAINATKHFKGNKEQRDAIAHLLDIEVRWYDSLAKDKPDYSLYNDPYIMADVWSCWVVYSSEYLKKIAKEAQMYSFAGHAINTVYDLGNGLGYTTAALKEIFPNASVYGTNYPGSIQWKVATKVGGTYGFKMADSIAKTDFVFASEYFEHFESPVEHLYQVLALGRPKVLVIANAFTARSLGHFNTYTHLGTHYTGKQISKIFNNTLRSAGYKMVDTGWWNNRPMVWTKVT